MSEYKIVYLIVERGMEPNRQVFWRSAGSAFICRDGSLNLKLDIHPGLTFNIRDPKSNGERDEAEVYENLETRTNGKQAGETAALPNVAAVGMAGTRPTNGRRSAVPQLNGEAAIVSGLPDLIGGKTHSNGKSRPQRSPGPDDDIPF